MARTRLYGFCVRVNSSNVGQPVSVPLTLSRDTVGAASSHLALQPHEPRLPIPFSAGVEAEWHPGALFQGDLGALHTTPSPPADPRCSCPPWPTWRIEAPDSRPAQPSAPSARFHLLILSPGLFLRGLPTLRRFCGVTSQAVLHRHADRFPRRRGRAQRRLAGTMSPTSRTSPDHRLSFSSRSYITTQAKMWHNVCLLVFSGFSVNPSANSNSKEN